MSPAEADAVLFGDALTCEDIQRTAFIPHPIDLALAEAACMRAESCLHAIAVIEDSRSDDDDSAQSQTLRRVEARLELLLALVGKLAQQTGADPLQSLRWSALGACIPAPATLEIGSTGTFRVQAASWLPEPLELPASVIASQLDNNRNPHLWLRFEPLSGGVLTALERHLFRQHRRAVAERRRLA